MDIDFLDFKIGDIINPSFGAKIAKRFKMYGVARRVKERPELYKDFIFDGCSCLPDELMGLFTGCKWEDITYLCCLPHDIAYAYGQPGDIGGKKIADEEFYTNLIEKAKMKKWLAKVFLMAVQAGGSEELGLSFSWGFANRKGGK